MSLNLPYSGVDTVEVTRYAVVAHAWLVCPLSLSAMVRIAADTMVWSRAARNMPSSNPDRISMIWLWVSRPDSSSGGAIGSWASWSWVASAMVELLLQF